MTRRQIVQQAARSPLEWLLGACLTLLGCAVALSVALWLLAQIWPWLLGLGLAVGGVAAWVRIAAARRRNW